MLDSLLSRRFQYKAPTAGRTACVLRQARMFFTVSQERSVWKVLHNLAQCQVVRCRPDPEHSQAHPVSECKNMSVCVCDIIIIIIMMIIMMIFKDIC